MRIYKKSGLDLIWKKISITKKVAVLVVLVLSLFFGLVLSIQSVFFGKLYASQRESSLKNAVMALSESYPDFKDVDEIQQYLNELSNESSSNIMILNSKKEVIYSLSYSMTVTDGAGNSIKIILDEMTRDKDFKSLRLEEGKEITAQYLYFEDERSNAYFPLRLENSLGEVVTKRTQPPGSKIFMRTITGKISNLILPIRDKSFNKMNTMRTHFLWTRDEQAIKAFEETGDFFGIFEEPEFRLRCMVFALREENGDILFATAPLISTNETTKMIGQATLPWLIFSLILSLVVAMIFSKQITKPIRKISRVTTKMKNLDFSEKCVLKSEDELGQLAENINDMSQKLDTTIMQLVEANKKLKADIEKDKILEQQRRDFVAAVSHELKTPLAIIRAYTEGLLDGVSQKNSKRYMQVIINETEKMDALILSMLENSRLEWGAEELVIKEHDLNALVYKVCKVFEGSTGFDNIHFKYRLCEKPVICSFDIDKIEQVINNFMSNAIKHTYDNGTIYIEVKETGEYCTVSFENEGDHIAEGDLERVWDKFYKSDKSRDRSDGSTGLGLSIAKNILRLHSAQYSVENTQIGVKFEFSIKIYLR